MLRYKASKIAVIQLATADKTLGKGEKLKSFPFIAQEKFLKVIHE
jgi:hypothetical protein